MFANENSFKIHLVKKCFACSEKLQTAIKIKITENIDLIRNKRSPSRVIER